MRRLAVPAVLLCLLAGCRWDGSDGRDRNPMNRPGYALPSTTRPEPTTDADHTVRGPATFPGNEASFELADGADTVNVTTADLPGAMFEMSTPEATPVVAVDGPIVIAGLHRTGRPAPATVKVTLNNQIRWTVRLTGGATDQTVDLTNGPGGDVTFIGGTSRAEVALPTAPGTQHITIAGGANEVVVRLAGTAPARVATLGGAGSVTIDQETHTGIPANAVWTPTSWPNATSRYDISATTGISTMTVTHN